MSEKPTPRLHPDQFVPERSQLESDPRFGKDAVEAIKGSAIWEGPDGDVRIKIDGFAGSADARPFFEASKGKEGSILVPLDQVRFSRNRERKIGMAGVDLEALRKTDYEQSPHGYERAYHSVPERQQRQIVRTAQTEAGELMGRAEELYRESELAKVRERIRQSEAYGANWSERDIRRAEREAVTKLDASPDKEFIDAAQAELERPEQLEAAIETELAHEPEEQRAALREEAARWTEFLEAHGEEAGVRERAGEAIDRAKEFEQAFAESPHSPELKQELREQLFETMERRARKLADGRLTAQALDAAREWMLELVKTGEPEQYEQTAQSEVLGYAKSRLKTWGKRLFGSFGRTALTVGAVAVGIAVPVPVGMLLAYGAVTGATIEGARAAYEGAKYQFARMQEQREQSARERRVREQLA